MEIFEGNPVGKKVWDTVWKLPIMQPGKQVCQPSNCTLLTYIVVADLYLGHFPYNIR